MCVLLVVRRRKGESYCELDFFSLDAVFCPFASFPDDLDLDLDLLTRVLLPEFLAAAAAASFIFSATLRSSSVG